MFQLALLIGYFVALTVATTLILRDYYHYLYLGKGPEAPKSKSWILNLLFAFGSMAVCCSLGRGYS